MLKQTLPLLLITLPAAASAGARQDAKVLLSDNPGLKQAQEEWGFADIVVAGDSAYLSGVVAAVRPGETDLKLAYERAFAQMGKTLERAGLGWDDVVDITSFHTDLTTQMPAIVAVKNKYVRKPPPAWTAIGVNRLIPDTGITEIKLIANVPKH